MFQFFKYHFSNWCLDTRFQELWLGEDKLEIEPLIYELLLYFLQHSTRIISRDELSTQVWKQGYVDDNAINRAISELRKILKEDTSQSAILKTHYKKGYRLLCEVTVSEPPEISAAPLSQKIPQLSFGDSDEDKINPAPENSISSSPGAASINNSPADDILKNEPLSPGKFKSLLLKVSPKKISWKKKTWFWLAGCVLLLVMTSLWYSTLSNSPRDESRDDQHLLVKVKETSLTWQKGQAFFPKLSANDRYLAYGHRVNHDDNWSLYIKDLSQGKKFAVTETKSHFYPLHWQGNKLIYQRRLGTYSEIWWVDMDDVAREHHKILQLPYSMPLSGALSDSGEIFYFSHFNYNGEPGVVLAVDLRNNQRFTVTAPPPDSFGDYSVTIAPDGKKLAFLRSQEGISSQVYLYDLSTQNTVLLYESSGYLLSLDWLHNSQQLVFIEPQMTLTKVNISNGDVVRSSLDYSEPLTFSNITSTGNIVASSGALYGRDIYRTTDCASESEAVIESNFSDFNPAIASQIAFVSNRSGSQQLWLREQDGVERQISAIPAGTTISELSWSPDETGLVGLLDSQLFVFYLPQNRWRYFPEVTGKIHMPRWSQDGKYLYYSSLRNNSRNIWRLDLITGAQQQVTFAGGVVMKDHPNLGLIYFKDDLSTLYRLDEAGNSEPLVENIQLDSSSGWTVAQQQLYFVEQGKLKSAQLGGENKVRTCQQPPGRVSQLSLDKQERLYFTLMTANPMNIVSLSY